MTIHPSPPTIPLTPLTSPTLPLLLMNPRLLLFPPAQKTLQDVEDNHSNIVDKDVDVQDVDNDHNNVVNNDYDGGLDDKVSDSNGEAFDFDGDGGAQGHDQGASEDDGGSQGHEQGASHDGIPQGHVEQRGTAARKCTLRNQTTRTTSFRHAIDELQNSKSYYPPQQLIQTHQ